MTPEEAGGVFEANGLSLEPSRIQRLLEYERLLLEWNTKINLVSRRATGDLFLRQIVGSVSFLFTHAIAGGTSLLDVGTGGGLPGIPLAIIHPDVRVTVLDSTRKKIDAVSDMIGRLGLANVRAVWTRVEDFDGAARGSFDYIVARGVSGAAEVVRWCDRLLRRSDGSGLPGRDLRETPAAALGTSSKSVRGRALIPPGSYVLLKGGDLSSELEDLSEAAAGASVVVRTLSLAGADDVFSDKKVIIVTP